MAFTGSHQRRTRARPCAVALVGLFAIAVSGLSLAVSSPSASATDPVTGVERATRAQGSGLLLIVTEARIEGSGPWTAWLGGAPERTLSVTVRNVGAAAVDQAEILLTFGRGGDPTTPLEPISVPPLEPGESTTLLRDIKLPRLALGTYAVEGEISGLDTRVEFRAETSHVPWLLLIIPALTLLQVILVTVRNRVRRRIHEGPQGRQQIPEKVLVAAAQSTTVEQTTEAEASPAPATSPAPAISPATNFSPAPVPDQLETIIGEELDAAFTDVTSLHDGTMTNGEWAEVITGLSQEAADRIADRAGLGNGESAELHAQITTEMLAAFGIDAETV